MRVFFCSVLVVDVCVWGGLLFDFSVVFFLSQKRRFWTRRGTWTSWWRMRIGLLTGPVGQKTSRPSKRWVSKRQHFSMATKQTRLLILRTRAVTMAPPFVWSRQARTFFRCPLVTILALSINTISSFFLCCFWVYIFSIYRQWIEHCYFKTCC